MSKYQSAWVGVMKNPNTFNFKVSLEKTGRQLYRFQCSNGEFLADTIFQSDNEQVVSVSFQNKLKFEGVVDTLKKQVRGFIHIGIHQYHIVLEEQSPHAYQGEWNMLFVRDPNMRMLLDVEASSANDYTAYPILGDLRAPRLMCHDFKKEGNQLFFTDARLGLNFIAVLYKDSIELNINLIDKSITKLYLIRQSENWQPAGGTDTSYFAKSYPLQMDDGWEIGSLNASVLNKLLLEQMEDSINANTITEIHSVLIARQGKLIYENYYKGYNAESPHDLRSAQKSVSSAFVGACLDRRLMSSLRLKVCDYLPARYAFWEKNDPRSRQITLYHLLTMSSGIDAVDFGTDRESRASEDAYQQTEDWAKTIFEAPILNDPGTHAYYGSANPCLIGTVMDWMISEPLELLLDRYLFEPLGISNYILQTDFQGNLYFAGGMFMTPRDMLKFGQMYANKGIWNGKRILSESWIEESFQKHVILENTEQKNAYGYYWWHRQYQINGKTVESVEARGAGGQYIFIIPDYQLVVAVTSGNFRNGRYWQPEKILENYILPAIH